MPTKKNAVAAAQTAENANANVANVVTIDTTITRVDLYNSADADEDVRILWRVYFADSFDAIDKEGHTVQRNYVDFKPSALLAQLISYVEGLSVVVSSLKNEAVMKADKSKQLSVAHIGLFFGKAEVTIERQFHMAGEIVNIDGREITYNHDGYSTNIAAVKPTGLGKKAMISMTARVLGLDKDDVADLF